MKHKNEFNSYLERPWTVTWVQVMKQNKDYCHLRFKLLKSKEYFPFVIDSQLIDYVELDEFIKNEQNRLALFIGLQFGINPDILLIPRLAITDI